MYMTHDKEALTTERSETVSSNLTATDINGMSNEFGQLYKIRNAKGKEIPNDCVRHFVLSLAPGEKLKPEQWAEVTKDFLESMGYDKTLHHAVKHSDTDHEHIHIACLRINPANGNLIPTSNEKFKALNACRDIEKKYGLKLASDSRKTYLYENLNYKLSSKLESFPTSQHWQIKNNYSNESELSRTFNKDFRNNKFLDNNLVYMEEKKNGKQTYLYCKFKNNCSARIYINSNKISLKGSPEAITNLKEGLKSSFETYTPVAKDENISNVNNRRGYLKEKINTMKSNTDNSNNKATSSVSKVAVAKPSVWDLVKPSASKPKVGIGQVSNQNKLEPSITSASFGGSGGVGGNSGGSVGSSNESIAGIVSQIDNIEKQIMELSKPPILFEKQQKINSLRFIQEQLKAQRKQMELDKANQKNGGGGLKSQSKKQNQISTTSQNKNLQMSYEENIKAEINKKIEQSERLLRELANAPPQLRQELADKSYKLKTQAEELQEKLNLRKQVLNLKSPIQDEAENTAPAKFTPPKPKGMK